MPPFQRLVELMRILRSPGGCAWDAKQTHESLIPYLIEETYEVIDALESLGDKPGNYAQLREELGDFLTQFVFHGLLAEEAGGFTVDEVITTLTDKLIRRHPHVFAEVAAPDDPAEVRKIWEKQKLKERNSSGQRKRLLEGVPTSMPALTRAYRLGEKAAGVGFDWPEVAPLVEKIDEELAELKVEIAAGDKTKSAEEIGDLLFVVASLARKMGINPERSLHQSLRKFTERFTYIEERVISSGRSWDDFTLEELESWWVEAKAMNSDSETRA